MLGERVDPAIYNYELQPGDLDETLLRAVIIISNCPLCSSVVLTRT